MIRPFTCICMLMAAGAGLYLYQTKHRAQLLDREIARTYKQIDQTKERIGVLKGEWALLNEPERLAELARQHLSLRSLAPTQFVAMADLGNRLPAPLPPGTLITPASDETPAPVQPAAVQPAPASVPVASARPAPAANAPKMPPVQLAALPKPALRQPPRAAAPAAPSVPASVAAAPASVAAAPASVAAAPAAQLPAVSPTGASRIMAPVVNVSASPIPPARPTPALAAAPAPAASRYAATTPAAPAIGSALGSAGHIALPAPVPYAASVTR